jgi:hypothetical protein
MKDQRNDSKREGKKEGQKENLKVLNAPLSENDILIKNMVLS